jgi:hypothetical protein
MIIIFNCVSSGKSGNTEPTLFGPKIQETWWIYRYWHVDFAFLKRRGIVSKHKRLISAD